MEELEITVGHLSMSMHIAYMSDHSCGHCVQTYSITELHLPTSCTGVCPDLAKSPAVQAMLMYTNSGVLCKLSFCAGIPLIRFVCATFTQILQGQCKLLY